MPIDRSEGPERPPGRGGRERRGRGRLAHLPPLRRPRGPPPFRARHVGQKAAAYTETDHEASGRDELLATLRAEIQDDPEVRETAPPGGSFATWPSSTSRCGRRCSATRGDGSTTWPARSPRPARWLDRSRLGSRAGSATHRAHRGPQHEMARELPNDRAGPRRAPGRHRAMPRRRPALGASRRNVSQSGRLDLNQRPSGPQADRQLV